MNLSDATLREQQSGGDNVAGATQRAQHDRYCITGATGNILHDESYMADAAEWAEHDERIMMRAT